MTVGGWTENQKAEHVEAIRQAVDENPDSQWSASTIRCLLSQIAERDQKIKDQSGWIWQYNENSERIGKALEQVREKRHTGEPAKSDPQEVAALVGRYHAAERRIVELESSLAEVRTELHQSEQLYSASVHERLRMADTEERLAGRYKEAVRIANRLMRLIGQTDQEALIEQAHEIMSGEIIEGVERERQREADVREMVNVLNHLSVHPDTTLADDIENHLQLALSKIAIWLPEESESTS